MNAVPATVTPVDLVLQHYRLPPHIKRLHPLQIEAINAGAERLNDGEWLDMGTGKTLVFTMIALYRFIRYGHVAVCTMPPLLVPQWGTWLRSITPHIGAKAITVTEYKGDPKQRKKLQLGTTFVVVGIQIFKRDFKRFMEVYEKLDFTFGVDESGSVANVETDNHQKCFDFSIGRARILLNGTPIGNPGDAYGQMKFTAPGQYKNLKEFQNLHVVDRDFFGNVSEWQNLDLLRDRVMVNANRILYKDMYAGTEEPLFDPIYYDLEADHYALYTKLAEEQILELENGGKIDATSANKLTHALGQIVVNWGHFAGVEGLVSNAVGMISEKLDEMGTGKLVVFCHYRLTAKVLASKLSKYGAVVINGDVSPTNKEANKQRFITDPSCRVIVIQFISGGKGLDGLQHVTHRCLFIEPCQQPKDFHQCVARLYRLGQEMRVHVMMAIAKGTLQVRGFKNLLKNDGIVNQVVRNAYDLRELIYGR